MSTSPSYPVLQTQRLLLRQFQLNDAADVQRLAGARELARSTFLPHPYKDGEAEMWIMSQYEDYKHQRMVNFAIVLKEANVLIGSVGLELEMAHLRAQLGYWVGLPYWNKGYCTEAAKEVVMYGFERLHLNRIYAPHFKSNPASGKVLKKIGMLHEGTQRQHYLRFGQFEDAELYGLMREEYELKNAT